MSDDNQTDALVQICKDLTVIGDDGKKLAEYLIAEIVDKRMALAAENKRLREALAEYNDMTVNGQLMATDGKHSKQYAALHIKTGKALRGDK